MPVIDCKAYAIYVAIVFIFIVMDFATGFIQAIATRTVSSTVMRRGLWHKAGIILAVFFGIAINITSDVINLGIDIPAVQGVAIYVVIMECRSIWENITVLAPDVRRLFDFGEDESE